MTSANTFGVATTGDLLSLLVKNGATFNLGHNLAALTVTVGEGGIFTRINQSAGTVTATNLDISAGGTYTQLGTGVLNTTNTTIGAGERGPSICSSALPNVRTCSRSTKWLRRRWPQKRSSDLTVALQLEQAFRVFGLTKRNVLLDSELNLSFLQFLEP